MLMIHEKKEIWKAAIKLSIQAWALNGCLEPAALTVERRIAWKRLWYCDAGVL